MTRAALRPHFAPTLGMSVLIDISKLTSGDRLERNPRPIPSRPGMAVGVIADTRCPEPLEAPDDDTVKSYLSAMSWRIRVRILESDSDMWMQIIPYGALLPVVDSRTPEQALGLGFDGPIQKLMALDNAQFEAVISVARFTREQISELTKLEEVLDVLSK